MALITKKQFGFQYKKKYYRFIRKKFDRIAVNEMAYCSSHNFLYDPEIEAEKLYKAIPCFYTDARYEAGGANYFHRTVIYYKKFRGQTPTYLKKIANKVRNVPNNKCFSFESTFNWKKYDFNYLYKGGREKYYPDYKIDMPEYFENFNEDPWAQNLTDMLKAEGFIVAVYSNAYLRLNLFDPDVIIARREAPICGTSTNQIAIGYGYGKIISFSTGKDAFKGYGNCELNILWNKREVFDKWKNAKTIAKITPLPEILNILKSR